MKLTLITILFSIFFSSSSYASPLLLKSCMKNMKLPKATSKKHCECLVKDLKTNPKITKMFKMSKKKFGEAFNQKIMSYLQKHWWSKGPLAKMPKSRKLSDEQSVILAISLNSIIACEPK